MTEAKASLWWRVQAAREHWMVSGATGLDRKAREHRWRNLGGGAYVKPAKLICAATNAWSQVHE